MRSRTVLHHWGDCRRVIVPRSYLKIFLWVVVVAAGSVRLVGITRGSSDWEDPPRFYHFHPDEDGLVRAALNLENPFAPPLSSYGPVSQYVLRSGVELVSPFWTDPTPGFASPSSRWRLFVVARLLAVVVSMLGYGFSISSLTNSVERLVPSSQSVFCPSRPWPFSRLISMPSTAFLRRRAWVRCGQAQLR